MLVIAPTRLSPMSPLPCSGSVVRENNDGTSVHGGEGGPYSLACDCGFCRGLEPLGPAGDRRRPWWKQGTSRVPVLQERPTDYELML